MLEIKIIFTTHVILISSWVINFIQFSGSFSAIKYFNFLDHNHWIDPEKTGKNFKNV